MAQKGWDATGLLEPLWLALKPPTPDELARRSGVHVKTIYSANSGDKPLGYKAGKKLADAAKVSLVELGAPASAADDPASRRIQDRLAELEAEVRWLRTQLTRAAALLKLELDPPATKAPARSKRARR